MKPFLVALAVCLASSRIVAQDLSSFEKTLIPVISTTTLHGGAASFSTILIASTPAASAFYPARGGDGRPTIGTISASTDNVDYWEAMPLTAGRLFYFDRAARDQLSLAAELRVTAWDYQQHRVTLPVVREASFRRGVSTIAGVPSEPYYSPIASPPLLVGFQSRTRLRIYDVDNNGHLAVTVRIHGYGARKAFEYDRYQVAVTARDSDDPSYPTYADVPLRGVCIDAPSGALCQFDDYAIVIEPSDPSIRYWAVASTTTNLTGETTLRFAQ